MAFVFNHVHKHSETGVTKRLTEISEKISKFADCPMKNTCFFRSPFLMDFVPKSMMPDSGKGFCEEG
jgi:hypothetical protein